MSTPFLDSLIYGKGFLSIDVNTELWSKKGSILGTICVVFWNENLSGISKCVYIIRHTTDWYYRIIWNSWYFTSINGLYYELVFM